MPDVVKHAWTHRPRALGGTDPLDINVNTTLPVAWARSNNGGTMADGTAYMITQLASATYDEEGMAEALVFANDPADGSVVFWVGDNSDRIMAYNGTWVVQVEMGITIPFGQNWTGDVTIWVDDTTGTIVPTQSPVFNNGVLIVDTQTGRNNDWVVRTSGTLVIDRPIFADIAGPFDQPFEIKVRQDTGGDLDWGEVWAIITVLTNADSTNTFP